MQISLTYQEKLALESHLKNVVINESATALKLFYYQMKVGLQR